MNSQGYMLRVHAQERRNHFRLRRGVILAMCKEAQLRYVRRVDIVWDEYIENSLKATTRSDRGAGVRRRVTANNLLPRKWNDFLRSDENKRVNFSSVLLP